MDLNLSVAYFSPTMGTKKAVTQLAELISNKPNYIDLTLPKNRVHTMEFNETDLLLVACPVYAGQLPPVEGLFTNLKGNHTPCIIMAAYGNRHYDDTLAQMNEILSKQGFYTIGAIACVIPHIFSARLGTNRPNEKDLEQFTSFAHTIHERLETKNFSPITLPGNPSPTPKASNPIVKTWDDTLCTNCQICVEACPTQAIDSTTLVCNDALCINCMRCSQICKEEARSFDSTNVRNYLESNYLEPRPIEVFL